VNGVVRGPYADRARRLVRRRLEDFLPAEKRVIQSVRFSVASVAEYRDDLDRGGGVTAETVKKLQLVLYLYSQIEN